MKRAAELADYLTYYYTPFESIGSDFSNTYKWKAHWEKKVYLELHRHQRLFYEDKITDGCVWLKQLTVPNPDDRRKGYMTEVFEMLKHACLQWSCSIQLFPDPFEFIGNNPEIIWEYGTDTSKGIFGYVGGIGPRTLTKMYGDLGFVPIRSKLTKDEYRPWLPSRNEPAYMEVANEKAYRNWQRPMVWFGSHDHEKLFQKYRLFGSELPDDGRGEHLREFTLDPHCLNEKVSI